MRKYLAMALAAGLLALGIGSARAQEGLGPFMPNEGGTITTAWGNAFGPDAESWMTFAKVGPATFDINYSSSRGMRAVRRILVQDRDTSLIFGMPGAAIAAGVADNVLPLDLIAPMLTSHCQANNTARHE